MTTLAFPTLVRHLIAAPTLPPPQGAYEYIVAANGLFLRAENARLAIQLYLQAWTPGTVRGVPPLEPYLRLRHPQLPSTLLHRLLADARTRRDAAGRLVEALYHVLPCERNFALIVPPQQATPASVTAIRNAASDPLLEIHSHGTMAAFWSATDNRDEGGFRFYGVVGRLEANLPEIRVRLGVYGYWWEVPLGVLFREDEPPAWQDLNAEGSALCAYRLPVAQEER